jgi:hypothetical protein
LEARKPIESPSSLPAALSLSPFIRSLPCPPLSLQGSASPLTYCAIVTDEARAALSFAEGEEGRALSARLLSQGMSWTHRTAFSVARSLAKGQGGKSKIPRAREPRAVRAEDIARIVAELSAEGWEVWKLF